MGGLLSLRTKSISIDGKNSIPVFLSQRLADFIQGHYIVSNTTDFIDNILKPAQPGELIIFYGETDDVVGFTRIFSQCLHINHKTTIVNHASTYHNPAYDLIFTAARLGLTQTMKYKLAHPEQELIYFSSVSSPAKYQFLAQLYHDIYPQIGKLIPEYVLTLVNDLKAHYGWSSSPAHPMLISGQLAHKHKTVLPNNQAHDPLIDYYLSINPDYWDGNALLVYIPLHLNNIGKGIRQLVSHAKNLYPDTMQSNHPLILNAG